MAHVISWFHIPEEEHELIAYLTRSRKVWAFAWNVDPSDPEYPAAPVEDFFREHGAALTRSYQATSERWNEANTAYWADPTAGRPNPDTSGDQKNRVYLGLREAVASPSICEVECLVGGRIEPTDQPGVGRIVGATKVRRRTLDNANDLLCYSRGAWLEHYQAFEGASLSYQAAKTSAEFERLCKQAFAWIRRWTPESVSVSNANYARRATKGANGASRAGKKFI